MLSDGGCIIKAMLLHLHKLLLVQESFRKRKTTVRNECKNCEKITVEKKFISYKASFPLGGKSRMWLVDDDVSSCGQPIKLLLSLSAQTKWRQESICSLVSISHYLRVLPILLVKSEGRRFRFSRKSYAFLVWQEKLKFRIAQFIALLPSLVQK